MTATDLVEGYDPYAAGLRANPEPVYAWLREEAPVYRHPEKGFYALSRFADVLAVLHDWTTYSSAQGITLEGLPPDVQPEMITMDPPRHDELRALVKRAFTPRAVAALEARVVEIAEDFAAVLDPDGFDLVGDVAGQVPSAVIAEMLGIPLADQPSFRSWIDVLIRRRPDAPETIAAARDASAHLSEFLAAQIGARRSHPTDDLIGFAVEVADHSGAMDDEELLGFVRLLLVAGNETTINLIGNAFLELGRHPAERALVADDPGLTGNAVEEVLRFSSPVPQLCRLTTRAVEWHDVVIPPGSQVVMVFAAANRDPREFADPDRFDVGRRFDRHLAFGHGIHHCLGAALARLQARAAVDAVLARFPDYALCDDIVEWLPSGHARGPVRLAARAG